MKKFILLAMAVGGVAVQASATVIDFEDLSGQAGVPGGYAGFTSWGGWQYYDWSQPPYNPSSGIVRCYITGGEPGSHVIVGSDIIFDGVWVSGYGADDGFGNVSVTLWNDGVAVHTTGDIDPSGTPGFLASGYGGAIDEFSVNTSTYGFQVFDDITYHPVPEPATMVALGVGAFALLRKRRR